MLLGCYTIQTGWAQSLDSKMDEEFDRELDDEGWGPVNPPDHWKPLGAQVNNTLSAASEVMSHKHNKTKNPIKRKSRYK